MPVKILILGGGQVGSSVVENLCGDANDITVVDLDADLLKALQDRYDIQTIAGNAAHPSVLEAAGADDTDMLLALTRDDETNLIACKLAGTLFNIPTKIARVRAADYVEYKNGSVLEQFTVDTSICPEQIVTDNLYDLFSFPGALQVLEFAGGRVRLVVVNAHEGGQLVGKPLRQISDDLPESECRICAIYRRDRLVIPDGSTVIEPDDEVFFVADTEHIRDILQELRASERPIRRAMIAGGGNIGYRLARKLETGYEVKIIEKRRARCEWLTGHLDHALVLAGEATDEDLLDSENIDQMDVFCALTNDDEDNIMSALLAKRLGARRVIALVNRGSYVDLLQGNRIDVVVSPNLSTIGSILAYIRRGDVEAVHPLRRGAAEAMEAIVHGDRKTSRLVGRMIDEVALPEGCYISARVRQGSVLMAHHDVIIESGDHLIVFVSRRRQIHEIEKLFEVRLGFF